MIVSEPFLEALPQVIILFAIAYYISVGENPLNLNTGFFSYEMTLWSSILSASFGLAKFLKLGPCRILPNSGWLGGYMKWSFLLTMINIMNMIIIYGYLLTFIPMIVAMSLWRVIFVSKILILVF